MRIFVTGATGFIGSAVVAELLAAGHSVLGQGAGRIATENGAPADPTSGRAATEQSVLASAERGVRAIPRETTGWAPTPKGLLADVRESGYFTR